MMNWPVVAVAALLTCALGQGIRAPQPGEEGYEQPNNCDLEICKRIKIKCDSRLTEHCTDGVYNATGGGPYCCCPVCFRNEGVRCNDHRICGHNLVCRNGFCRPWRYY